jgi:hypothetical protein
VFSLRYGLNSYILLRGASVSKVKNLYYYLVLVQKVLLWPTRIYIYIHTYRIGCEYVHIYTNMYDWISVYPTLRNSLLIHLVKYAILPSVLNTAIATITTTVDAKLLRASATSLKEEGRWKGQREQMAKSLSEHVQCN